MKSKSIALSIALIVASITPAAHAYDTNITTKEAEKIAQEAYILDCYICFLEDS